jgi:hypothetical protein
MTSTFTLAEMERIAKVTRPFKTLYSESLPVEYTGEGYYVLKYGTFIKEDPVQLPEHGFIKITF